MESNKTMDEFNYTDEDLLENLRKRPGKSSIKTHFTNAPRVVQNMIHHNGFGTKTIIIDGLSLETWIKMLITHMEGYDGVMLGALSKELYLGFNFEGQVAANARMCQDLFRDKLDVLWNYMVNGSGNIRYLNHFYKAATTFITDYGSWCYKKDIRFDEPKRHFYDDKGIAAESHIIPANEGLRVGLPICAATILCITATVSNKMHIKTLRTFLDILYGHYHSLALEVSSAFDNQ